MEFLGFIYNTKEETRKELSGLSRYKRDVYVSPASNCEPRTRTGQHSTRSGSFRSKVNKNCFPKQTQPNVRNFDSRSAAIDREEELTEQLEFCNDKLRQVQSERLALENEAHSLHLEVNLFVSEMSHKLPSEQVSNLKASNAQLKASTNNKQDWNHSSDVRSVMCV